MLGNKMAVVRWPSEEQIEMYDATTLVRKPRIVVRGMSDDIFGFASCSTNNCFYISDWQNSVIHRVTMTAGGDSIDRGKALSRWSVNLNPMGLSVNRALNVLLTYWNSSVIDEFTTRGTKVRAITLQPSIVHLWVAVEVHHGDNQRSKFVVSHGDHDDPLCQVSVCGLDGRKLASFGGKPGSGMNQLNVPTSVAVTARDHRILVTDQKNGRVLLLQLSLNGSSRDLLASVDCELHGPCAICLDESRGRLFVGCWDGRLLLFDNVIDNSERKS
jgi:hypothetical protein